MKTITKVLLTTSVLGLALGIYGIVNTQISGLALAMGAVTFALAFITYVVGKAEDEEVDSAKKAQVAIARTKPSHTSSHNAVIHSAVAAVK